MTGLLGGKDVSVFSDKGERGGPEAVEAASVIASDCV
jgi:hypothetical protein